MVRIVYILLVFISTAFVHAKNFTISENLSRNLVRPGDVFSIDVSIESKSKLSIKKPKPPSSLDPFQWNGVQQSYSFSTNYSSAQKIQSIHKVVFSILLSSQKEGNFKIPPFSIVIDNQVYKTKSLSVNISNQASPLSTRRQGLGLIPDVDDIFSGIQPFFGRSTPLSKDNFLLKAHVKKLKIYEGEILPFQIVFYQKSDGGYSARLPVYKPLQMEGVVVEHIKTYDRLEFLNRKVINNKTYLEAVLQKLVLFPLRKGFLKIPSIQATAQIRDSSSFFNFGSLKTIPLKSQSISIEVIPLPKKFKRIFTGAVGDFVIHSEVDHARLQQGDALTYTIRFEGQGNVHNIQIPPWPKNSDFKVYSINETEQFNLEKNSYKEYKILLLSQKVGAVKTPALKWTTFNPELKSYVQHIIRSIPIYVQKSPSKNNKSMSNEKYFNQNLVEGSKKLTKKQSTSILNFNNPIYKKIQFGILAVLIWGILFFLLRKLILFLLKRNRLRNEFQSYLKRAQRAIDRGNYKEAGSIMLSMIDQLFYLIIGTKGRSVEQLLEQCHPSIRKELGEKITTLNRELENFIFSSRIEPSAAHSKEKMQNCLKSARELSNQIIDNFKE